MKHVFRNHTHGSEIILSICEAKGAKYAKKSTYSKVGISELQREFLGYSWYLNQQNHTISVKITNIEDIFFEIQIPFFEAKAPVRKNITNNNLEFYVRAIDHYNDVWCRSSRLNGMVHVHGDYSLDGNILFDDDNIFIIDWEHFHETFALRGFDVLYLIFEAIKISCGSKLPSRTVLNLGKKLIKYSFSIGALDDAFFTNTFSKFLIEQERISPIWTDQAVKIPTKQFSNKQLDIMLQYFNHIS